MKTNTSTTKNFRAIVNEAGLPVEMGLVAGNVSNAVVGGLTAEELAWLYWMTKSIRIEYCYVINGRVVERQFELDASEQEPENRSLIAPVLTFNYFDQKLKTSTNIHIPVHLACKNINNSDLFDVPITFMESAPNGIFSLEIANNNAPIDKITTLFFGKQLELGVYSKNPKLPAKINYANFNILFFNCDTGDP